MKKTFSFATVSFFAFAVSLCADVKMPRIFSNGMVLQRGEPVNVWGTSAPNAKIEVSFAGAKTSATAGADGGWSLKLPPMEASQECRNMIVSENGVPKKNFSDVLVGEVWIVGGQSNMAFSLKGMAGAKEIIANANNALIRYFNQGGTPQMRSMDGIGKNPEPDTVKGSGWLVCSPKNAEYSFAAVPYIFARDIAKKLNIPVGIVYTAIPGTRMVSWIPRGDFENNPDFAGEKAAFEARLKRYDAKAAVAKFEDDVRTYPARVEKAKKEGKRPPEAWTVSENLRPWSDSPDKWATPCMLYNIRISPIKKFTARGIFWYQGESDSAAGAKFGELFGGFVKVWRRELGKPDMPFVFVQLPSFNGKNWSEVRLGQQAVADKLSNMFMAATIDTGDADDIHPKDKLAVGERSAALALAKVYRVSGVRSAAPSVKGVRFDGNSATVDFKTEGRLVARGNLRGFEVRSGGKWLPAGAKLRGNSVVVSAADKSAKIDGVRYLYKDWAKPDVSLFDDAGLPAYPFSK